MSKHYNQKNAAEQEIKQIDETKVDEIILESEKEAQDAKLNSAKDISYNESIESVKKIGEKISLILVFVLLILSIIQSIELFNLRNQIVKSQFSGGSAVPAAGSQDLPSQQGGC